ncbi:hypothetical protein CEXT_670811 [Caerostris extrusa]|uniref:Uncharacterized protein n=1 Tax=Caerostris extrusa TaxID=172846 RepID=A0AAV4U771_CAEEX|nr:hypothetical protein CEXT_670811 [Caerostris extrusa]
MCFGWLRSSSFTCQIHAATNLKGARSRNFERSSNQTLMAAEEHKIVVNQKGVVVSRLCFCYDNNAPLPILRKRRIPRLSTIASDAVTAFCRKGLKFSS